MDIDLIVSLIANVGFPIVACGFMYKMNNDLQKEHKQETEGLRKVIENNTSILNQLKTEIEVRWAIINNDENGGI